MPKILPNSFRVKRGNDYITVGPYTHPETKKKGWRFGYQVEPGPGKPWRYVTRRKKDEARVEAEEILNQRAEGLVWSSLSLERRRFLETIHRKCAVGDQDALVAFLDARASSVAIEEAVPRFLSFKIKSSKEGKETRHLQAVRRDLEELAAWFPGRTLPEIYTAELEEFWEDRAGEAAEARTRAIRTTLVSFWNWARLQQIAGNDAKTPAERLPPITVPKGKRIILSIDEQLTVLREVRPQFRAAIVLGSFFGLRPEEAAPVPAQGKPGVSHEDIDWEFRYIAIREETSKVGRARHVPFPEHAEEWLEWAGVRPGMTGLICPLNAAEEEETKRLGLVLDEAFGLDRGWPSDCLRHSYGSYRNSILRNLEQVALEMGTSVRMLHNHYLRPLAERLGRLYFGLRPRDLKRSDKSNILQHDAPILEGKTA